MVDRSEWLGWYEFTEDEALNIELRNRGNADVARLLEVIRGKSSFRVLKPRRSFY